MLRRFQVKASRVFISDDMGEMSQAMLDEMGEPASSAMWNRFRFQVDRCMSITGTLKVDIDRDVGMVFVDAIQNASYEVALIRQQGGVEIH